MIDETVNDNAGNAGSERVGFCQDCGKPLTRETVRTVGSGIFCEPCLETRLAGTAAVPPYGTVPPPPAANAVPPNVAGSVYSEPFPPIGGNSPSPVLAAFLGLIPGVGAMYNGQFAKGIAHIIIYALLQSMARMSDFFGFLVAGWIAYQAFEAYHTAKARREGRPLPDPLGLNNIGEYVGIHFRGNGTAPNPIHSAGHSSSTSYAPPEPFVPPAQPWGSVPVPPASAAYVSPYAQSAPYTPPPPVWETPAWTAPATDQTGYSPVAPVYPVVPVRKSTVPAAAVWLIGFGVVFLVFDLVPEWRFSVHKVFPFLLMAFAIWLFTRRMMISGGITPADGEGEGYATRAVCFLRMPVILFTVSVLWMLQEFDVLRFGRTWPVLVIMVGVLMLLERSIGSRAVPVAPVVDASASNGAGKGN
jgi:hypothetical protein